MVELSYVERHHISLVVPDTQTDRQTHKHKDFGVELKGRLSTDSSAGKGIASRIGLGKVKHLHTQFLWVQERVANNDFTLRKVGTDDNVGDLMTKYLDRPKLDKFTHKLGYTFRPGRHELAPLHDTASGFESTARQSEQALGAYNII